MDEAQVEEVARHLVGDAAAAWRACPQAVEVGQAQAPHVGLGQGRHAVHERAAGPGTGGLVDALVQVLEFASTVHTRMAAQDLLEQGGARAGHADDEDRCAPRRLRTAPRAPGLEEIGIEHRQQAVQQCVGGLLVHRHLRMLQPVAFFVCGEGPVVLADVFKRLAQREAQPDAQVRAELFAADVQGFHHGQLRIGRRVGLERTEVVVRLDELRTHRDGGLETRPGQRQLALLHVDSPRIALGLCMPRVEFDGAQVGLERLVLGPLLPQGGSQVVP